MWYKLIHYIIFSDFDITLASIELTSSATYYCILLDIIDDDIIGTTEFFNIILVQRSVEVEFVDPTATIEIIDNDSEHPLM